MRVGVRRHQQQLNYMTSSVISSHSMNVGILATAAHALQTNTLFSVYYKPRFEFIVSVDKYLEAKNHQLCVGTRFKMRFEGDEGPEKRFSGTIVGVDDISPSSWPNSDWRSLKVQWDEPSSILRPERPSLWDVEPLVQTYPENPEPIVRNKRPHPAIIPSSVPNLSSLGIWKSPGETSSAAFFGSTANSSLPSASSQSIFWTNKTEHMSNSFGLADNKETGVKRKIDAAGVLLFGVTLYPPSLNDAFSGDKVLKRISEEQPVPSLVTESGRPNVDRLNARSLSCDCDKSLPRSPPESQSKQSQTPIKVYLNGMSVGRTVDLARFDCYEDFFKKLEQMFDTKEELCGSTGKWQVVYRDYEDDLKMVGDDPWPEFCTLARQIYVYPSEEVKRLPVKKFVHVAKYTEPGNVDTYMAVASEDHASAVGPSY